ncbi:probable serine/threonine-protein kinase pXi [Phlebotomus papatasi]|uniref:probable serine/threonine-protein kinase pXi n=1 Tax=Phlebotomus papatasi TaxID=29031 RepID=UPI002483C4A5|nr:probable serine/threonine-protein kinase pXi [Phlebotomus papatasi]
MEACDLWSLVVILYTMLCGQSPFRSPSDSEESICGLVEKIRLGDFDTKTPAWRCVSPSARDLVTRLLNVDSERRMEMNELVNHSWLQGTTLRKSQLPPLTLAQDLASLDLTVKAIFDAYKHAQSKGFTMFEVENAKLSQRRRHKNSSHSSESDLGRSKSSSGVVTSDLNNRSLSVESSDIEIVGEFQMTYPSGATGDGAGITLNNNEEATKDEITENEVNCDANVAEVEVGSNNVKITETKVETEEVREHSTMEEVVEKKEEEEIVVKVDVKVETSKKVKEVGPVKESKRILSHYLANMHHGFKENGEEESHSDDVFAGFSVEDIKDGYKSSMRNGEICASILNSRKSQPKLRGRKRKIKTEIPDETQYSNGKISKLLEVIPPAMVAKPARVSRRMTTRHMRREEICGRDDLFKDYIAFSYIQLN